MAAWTSDARALVDRAIAAHGGRDAWLAARRILLPFESADGFLLRRMGYGRTFTAPRLYDVRPHEGTAIFHDYPDAQHRGRFETGDVVIESLDSRDAPVESLNHRCTFAGVAKYRRWNALDALYFFGYALVHYHRLPFTLMEADLVDVVRHDGVPVGVDVVFSPDVETHSPRQRFVFGDADGRIVRHDYVADVIGPVARGAHFWLDYERVSGLLVARRRRVLARFGSSVTPLAVLDVRFGQVSVEA
jgi:hypothetical protein